MTMTFLHQCVFKRLFHYREVSPQFLVEHPFGSKPAIRQPAIPFGKSPWVIQT